MIHAMKQSVNGIGGYSNNFLIGGILFFPTEYMNMENHNGNRIFAFIFLRKLNNS